MANVTWSIKTPGGAIPKAIRDYFAELSSAHKSEVSEVAVAHVCNFTRNYIRSIVPQNHKTANSFDPAAQPTGHLEKAARNTIFRLARGGGIVSITSPGITRAFRDLHIRAKGKMLTIPARPSPEAYGKRAREVALMEPLFLVKTKAAGAFLATGTEPMGPQRPKGRRPPPPQRVRPHKPNKAVLEAKEEHGIRPVFWLRSAVTIPQKRDILPSDKQLATEARAGFARGIKALRLSFGLT